MKHGIIVMLSGGKVIYGYAVTTHRG